MAGRKWRIPVISTIRQTRTTSPACADSCGGISLAWRTPPLADSRICLYTQTPDEHFIVDTHPQHAHVGHRRGLQRARLQVQHDYRQDAVRYRAGWADAAQWTACSSWRGSSAIRSRRRGRDLPPIKFAHNCESVSAQNLGTRPVRYRRDRPDSRAGLLMRQPVRRVNRRLRQPALHPNAAVGQRIDRNKMGDMRRIHRHFRAFSQQGQRAFACPAFATAPPIHMPLPCRCCRSAPERESSPSRKPGLPRCSAVSMPWRLPCPALFHQPPADPSSKRFSPAADFVQKQAANPTTTPSSFAESITPESRQSA